MKFKAVLLSALVGIGAAAATTAVTTTSAAAAVVCNRDGDCWRVRDRYSYRPAWGLRVYNDNWRWRDSDRHRYRWRDARPGRGYYRGGVWVTF
ncbi:MAG TPA: hypothetical protein VFQ69_03065 [Rhizomicrobium sp.]|nr:hypothetical protein [Rhizomicrobium sp.]